MRLDGPEAKWTALLVCVGVVVVLCYTVGKEIFG